MDGYLGQFIGQSHRSKVKIMGSENVHLGVPLTSESLVYLPEPEKKLSNTTGRSMMWGVFKAYAFFL